MFVAPATASTASTVTNDGWFPDVDLADLREVVRVDGNVPEPRLRAAAVAAMSEVNDVLATWAAQHRARGIERMEDVPSTEIDGRSRLVSLYLRAVYATTKADLTERYRDVDTTGAGHRRADDLTPSIAEQRRNARFAVRDILGRTRTTVDLI